MIEVVFHGRLGNNLFQYVMGRLLAENLKYALSYIPDNFYKNSGIDSFLPNMVGDSYNYPIEYLDDNNLDINRVISNRSNRKIILDGYFQKYGYYQPYKELVRSWLPVPEIKVEDNAVVCHIRREDYTPNGTGLVGVSFYTDILDRENFSPVYICGIGITNQIKRRFEKYHPIYVTQGIIDDLMFMANFPNIIMSNSTFAWWAAFLSKAKRIFHPIPPKGFWNPACHPNIDLQVKDEGRYRFINAVDMD